MNIKRFLTFLFLMAPLAVMAQVKIATVNVNDVFNAMSETKEANATLEALSGQLKAEYEFMLDEFNNKYAAYQAMVSDTNVPTTIKDRRVQEIQDADRELNQFLEKSKSAIEERRQALEAPIRDKIYAVIKQLGDTEGYTYIFDTSVNPLAYSGPSAIDITQRVKKILGAE
jgi:outer membrane protein